MSDWKKDFERKLQAQQEAEAKREAARREKEAEEQQKNNEIAAREHARRFEEHKRRFKCHMCGKMSNGPAETKIVGYRPARSRSDPEADDVPVWGDNWDEPTGLEQCSVCGKWTCTEHLYSTLIEPKGVHFVGEKERTTICEKDARDGYLPGQKRGWSLW